MSRIPLIILLVLLASTTTFAQSKTKSKKKPKKTEQRQQASSLSPYFPKDDYAPEKAAKKKSKGRKATYNAMEEHEARMKSVAKAHRKAEKESMKPQYSDPSYFGHKRKPKKRPPGKMKFCKECEIRH